MTVMKTKATTTKSRIIICHGENTFVANRFTENYGRFSLRYIETFVNSFEYEGKWEVGRNCLLIGVRKCMFNTYQSCLRQK